MKKDRIQSRMKNSKVIPREDESGLPREGLIITEWRSGREGERGLLP